MTRGKSLRFAIDGVEILKRKLRAANDHHHWRNPGRQNGRISSAAFTPRKSSWRHRLACPAISIRTAQRPIIGLARDESGRDQAGLPRVLPLLPLHLLNIRNAAEKFPHRDRELASLCRVDDVQGPQWTHRTAATRWHGSPTPHQIPRSQPSGAAFSAGRCGNASE
jgi:hypothetical protein